jgi:predicted transcriptional regulator
MLSQNYEPAAVRIRRIIAEKGVCLTELARIAEVRYPTLYRWVTGRQETYDVIEAERVYYALTGKTFLP